MTYNYALFVHAEHEAAGGWDDLAGIFEFVEEAMAKGKEACTKSRCAHIVHLLERRIVLRGQWRHIPSTLTGEPGTTFFEWAAEDEAGS
jgi:hypothetical protein